MSERFRSARPYANVFVLYCEDCGSETRTTDERVAASLRSTHPGHRAWFVPPGETLRDATRVADFGAAGYSKETQ